MKEIRELARMTMMQCKDKLVSLIKESGNMYDLDIRIDLNNDEVDDVVTITKIEDGVIFFENDDDCYEYDIADFTMDELYTIIKFL